MDVHPALAALPTMSEERIKELAEDIRRNGLKNPIAIDPQGRLLDGRARLAACRLAGVDPKSSTYRGDPIAFVFSTNYHRLHWVREERAVVAARLVTNTWGGSRRSKNKAPDGALESVGREEASSRLRIPQRDIDRARVVLRYADKYGDRQVLDDLEQGAITLTDAERQTRKLETERELNKGAQQARSVLPRDEEFNVEHGDCRKLAQQLSDDSISLIYTDPPWDAASLHLYDSLGEIANRVLRPGGYCLTYVGSMFLNRVIERLDKHLAFVRPYAIYFRGGNTQQHNGVGNRFRLLLLYRKPGKASYVERTHNDVVVLDDGLGVEVIESAKQKNSFRWEQSAVEAEILITALCADGIVADLFCGSGTTGVAVASTNRQYGASRRFVGYEIDERLVLIARRRIMEEQNKAEPTNSDEASPPSESHGD